MSEQPLLTALVAAIAALLLSAVITAAAQRYALRRQLLDLPGQRRSHRAPTPRGGGIGMAATGVLGALTLAAMFDAERLVLLGFALGLAAVAVVGAMDDHRPQSVKLRLLVHLSAALLFVAALLGPPQDALTLAARAAAVIALVGMINIWNFMDGIDGLAASQAALVAATVAILAWAVPALALMAATVAGATLGFLPFNAPKARIFMGDVGSGSLGFAIGALLLTACSRDTLSWPLALLPISAFGLDAGLTLLLRMVRGKRWWSAHREHLYQWLVRRGYRHVAVTTAYALWTLSTLGLLALACLLAPTWHWLLSVLLLGAGAGTWCIIRRRLWTAARRRTMSDAALNDS